MFKSKNTTFGYNEEEMQEINAIIKERPKLFARLIILPVETLTFLELQMLHDSAVNLQVAITHTVMSDAQICRMAGISQNRLEWFRENHVEYIAKIEEYLIKNANRTQEESLIFTPEKVREEIKELEDIMYALYKNEMMTEDICEYCRVFVLDTEWKLVMRSFQKRFRDECNREYKNRVHEKLRYEREQKRKLEQSKTSEQIKSERAVTKEERLKKFLGEEPKSNLPENPAEPVSNIKKKVIITEDGREHTIWG